MGSNQEKRKIIFLGHPRNLGMHPIKQTCTPMNKGIMIIFLISSSISSNIFTLDTFNLYSKEHKYHLHLLVLRDQVAEQRLKHSDLLN